MQSLQYDFFCWLQLNITDGGKQKFLLAVICSIFIAKNAIHFYVFLIHLIMSVCKDYVHIALLFPMFRVRFELKTWICRCIIRQLDQGGA